MSKDLTPESLTFRTRAVIDCYLSNPTYTYDQLAQAVGVSRQRVSQILRSPKVTKLYPILARRTIQSRILPKALKRYETLIEHSQNDAVAEKAAGRILSTEGVLSDGKTDVNVNVRVETTLKDVHALRKIVSDANALPENVVDGELVDPPTP